MKAISFLIVFTLFSNFLFATNEYSAKEIKNLKIKIAKLYSKQKYFDAIKSSRILIQKCKKYHLSNELTFAYENLGIFYSDISDFKTSINYYNKALKNCSTNKDSSNFYSIFLNLGTTLMDATNYKDAKFYIEKAKNYYQNFKPISYPHLIASYTNLAITYQNLHQINKALYLNSKAIQLAESKGLISQFSGSYINMGDLYVEMGKLDKGLSYYKDAAYYFEKVNDQKSLCEAKLGIATILQKERKYREAIPILTNVSNYFIKIHYYKEAITCYNKLSVCYFELKDYKKATTLKNQELIYYKKFKKAENIQTISNLQLQHQIYESENRILIKNKLIEKEKRISTLLIITILLLFLSIYVLLKLYKKRQTEFLNKSEQIEKNAEVQKADFTEKLSHKDQELETFALHIVHKNEFLDDLQNELKSLKKLPPDKLIQQLSTLLFKLSRNSKKEQELKQFLNRVEEVNSNFYSILNSKYPQLTSKEKKLCALIKLNLSSKDIALLTNVTVGAVTMARYRLRTKINIDKDESLTELFQNLN